MFLARPLAHVETDLTDHDQGGGLINPLNPCQVHPCHAIEWFPGIERRAVTVAAPLAALGGQRCAMALVRTRLHRGRNAGITGGELPMLECIALERLLQDKQMLDPPRPVQGGGNGGLVLLAAGITPPRELPRVAFTGEDGPDDGE